MEHNFKLLKSFENGEKPEIVLQYIYNNVYELTTEMNEFIHDRNHDKHYNHNTYRDAYRDYYRELVNKNIDKSILYYFPNPDHSLYFNICFNFIDLFVGVVGRILCNLWYLYGDPITWNLAYHIDPIGNKVWIRRYTLLDHYKKVKKFEEFEEDPLVIINEDCVIYRTISEESMINSHAVQYRPLDVISRLEQRKNSDNFNFFFDPRIEALLHDVYEQRRDVYELKRYYIKPLYAYIEDLKDKLKEEFSLVNIDYNYRLMYLFKIKEKPEIVLQYIYDNVYELIKEIKKFSHPKDENIYGSYLAAYFFYYNDLLEKNTNISILYYFPNPDFVKFRFSFKNFFIGVVGRILCNTEYLYGDPLTWHISYAITYNPSKKIKVSLETRKYFLLENYNEFQIDDSYWDGFYIEDISIIYKTIGEETSLYYKPIAYRPLDIHLRVLWRNWADFAFKSNIVKALDKIYTRRVEEEFLYDEEKRPYDQSVKPLCFYIKELEELLSE